MAGVAIGAYFKYSFTYNPASNSLTARVEGAKLQKSVMNLLSNHNAEFARDWSSQSWTDSAGTTGYATTYKYLGNQALTVNYINNRYI